MNIFRRSARTHRSALTDEQLRATWQTVSVLLDYPTEASAGLYDRLRSVVAGLPSSVSMPLGSFLSHVESVPLRELQEQYVRTFDHTRRGCLYLTYFAYGDTRRRGVVLVEFKQAYRRGGMEFTADELPDHIGVVLEFGATADLAIAWKLLGDYRAGVEMLRVSLQDSESAWADLLVALCATLPPLGEDEREAVARLIEQGPPQEEVGMDGYAADPRLSAFGPGTFSPVATPSPDRVAHLGTEIPVGAPR